MAARHQRPEVRAHPRHRGRRQDHPPRHVLRDVRQLLLRRLLQGRCHRARVGPADQVGRRRRLRARRVAALPVGPRRRRGGHRPLDEGHRPAARADRPARQQGELLVDGRARPRWAVLGDPLRPRSRVGPGLRRHDPRPGHALRARGPAAGDLEPGLHAGRALRGALEGGLRHRRLAAEEEHRHRHGPGPGRVPAPGQEQHVRDRRDVPRDREGRAAHRPPLRRGPRGRRAVPRGRRPRALLDDAHRRRRHPRQRRPRLRPAPPAAPRGALDAPARLRGPGAARADAGLARPDGGDLRQPHQRLAAHLAGRVRRGGRLPQDPAGRHPDLRRRRLRGEADRAARRCPASAPSRCTTPTASRSTSRWRWRPSRACRSTSRASAA